MCMKEYQEYRNKLPNILSCCDTEDTDIIQWFMNLPALQEMKCPLNLSCIQHLQTLNAKLLTNN